MNNKECYDELCKTENDICVYDKPFWLDAVCGQDNWDVLLYREDEKIVAALPYYIKTRHGLKYITQPKFTQSMGIWIKYNPNFNLDKRLSFEKKVFFYFVEQISKLNILFSQQCFHTSLTNWLPFYWKGYKQSTLYTYRIPDISDVDGVVEKWSHAKRKNIKKAEAANIQIKYDLSAEEFYKHHKYTLEKQGRTISYTYDSFLDIYNAVYQNGCGKTFYAVDEDNNIHVALFVIWDNLCAYELISTIDGDYKNCGAPTLIIKYVLQYLSDKVKSYDFEGSMIEGVENSFKQLGTEQLQYFTINKIYSKNPIIKFFITKKLNS